MKRLFVIFLTICMCFVGCTGRSNTPTDATTADAIGEDEHTFIAVVLQKNGDSVLVEPIKNDIGCDRISFSVAGLDCEEVLLFDTVEVTYTGGIMESYPAQIKAVALSHSEENTRDYDYGWNWLDKEAAESVKPDTRKDSVITRIYSDCFFVRYSMTAEEFKFNEVLSNEWCVGDLVDCTYENAYYDEARGRYEADIIRVKESAKDNSYDPGVFYKPVIYLYPESETEVSVSLNLDGELTCTYPAYGDGWKVTASPDGTLADENGQTYSYLYWEGVTRVEYDFSRGFCVKGEDTAEFLEVALEKLGLNRREANEFIVYWLPLMEGNPYNIISFQTDAYTDAAKLCVVPTPDTVNRVFMAWKASDEPVDILEQILVNPEREGFTVIEWGGTEVK